MCIRDSANNDIARHVVDFYTNKTEEKRVLDAHNPEESFSKFAEDIQREAKEREVAQRKEKDIIKNTIKDSIQLDLKDSKKMAKHYPNMFNDKIVDITGVDPLKFLSKRTPEVFESLFSKIIEKGANLNSKDAQELGILANAYEAVPVYEAQISKLVNIINQYLSLIHI